MAAPPRQDERSPPEQELAICLWDGPTHALHLATPAASPPTSTQSSTPSGVEAAMGLLDRMAFGCSGPRRTLLLSVGRGRWQGASIVVDATDGRAGISVRVMTDRGAEADAWRERLERRFADAKLDDIHVEIVSP
jgi:hypothetical protein